MTSDLGHRHVHRWRTIDPDRTSSPAQVEAHAVPYAVDRLLVSSSQQLSDGQSPLQRAAASLGWELTQIDKVGAVSTPDGGLSVVKIEANNASQRLPDAWTLLQRARQESGDTPLQGVCLDHAVALAIGSNPFAGVNPFGGVNPVSEGNGNSPLNAYQHPGAGGLQPISYVGAPPRRKAVVNGRRINVGVMDTGCGQHPWFDGRVDDQVVQRDFGEIGLTGLPETADSMADLVGPLDGMRDKVAGHGTFICGLIHQGAPDADIYIWRVADPTGVVAEHELVDALDRLVALLESGTLELDVLVLPLGYYHETPIDSLFDPTIYGYLARIGRTGTVVVASAGNDATDVPYFPAAFAHWPGCPVTIDPSAAPLVGVGALNPDGSDALFSNDGPWVHVWERGAAVMSTMPTFDASLQPTIAMRTTAGRNRRSIDPDNFSSGFALWSGTSFAAPIFAARVAAALRPHLGDNPVERVSKAWRTVTRLTTS